MNFMVECAPARERDHWMQSNTTKPEEKTLARDPKQTHEAVLQLVGFRVGEEEFAIDILRVQEIIRAPQLTRVPNAPEVMEGVMNLRGKIIPVIALRRRFGLEEVPPDKQNRIVVVEIQGTVLGLSVDAVSEVLRFPAEKVEPPPRLGLVEREYVSGVGRLGDRLLILLDADRLMSNSEEGMVGAAGAQA
jgi:purine-binding chemotaxis protein CheW